MLPVAYIVSMGILATGLAASQVYPIGELTLVPL